MPNLSIYITDEIYQHLMAKGKPSAVGKEWIEERFNKENKKVKS
jgi:hypothetical protein